MTVRADESEHGPPTSPTASAVSAASLGFSHGTREPGPVAYLIKMFPRLSETFILNEILELKRRGVEIRLVSLMRPTGSVLPPEAGELMAETFYVPAPTRSRGGEDGWRRVLADHRALLRRNPGRYLRALFLAARRFSPTAWKRFYQAGPVAHFCAHEGVSHLHAAFAHTPTSVAFWTARLTGIPYSFSAHAKDLYLSDRKSLLRKMEQARFVFTCTEANGAYLRSLGGSTPVHVGYHGSDLSRFVAGPCDPQKEDPEGGGPERGLLRRPRAVILAVGRLVPKKGFGDLLRAAELLSVAGLDFELVFVGDGPLRASLEESARSLGLAERVRFLGNRAPAEVRDQYCRATVVALPSVVLPNGDRDGIPNVLVEAMAAGVPVVSTRASAIPELVTDGVTGLLVPPSSPERLAAALSETLADPEAARARAERAREDLARRFDLRRNSAVIAGLLQKHRRPTRCLYVSMDLGVPVRGHKGASAHVRQVAEHFSAAGVDTRILTPSPGPEEPAGNAVGVPLVPIRPLAWMDRLVDRTKGERRKRLLRELRRLLYNFSLARTLLPLLREVRPDFVYERYSLCAVATGLACRRRGIPWLLEVNAPLADEEAKYRGLLLGRLTRALERWILRRADAVFVVSPALRSWAILSRVHPDRVFVLPNGVDRSRFHPGVDGTEARRAWGWTGDEVVVAFAGSLKPWHGGEALLNAVAHARVQCPRLRLVFIGEGPEAGGLRKRTRKLGLADSVLFTGAVPHAAVPRMLRGADILAAPYLDQQQFYFSPLKILEYLAAGRPVVATRLGQIRDLVPPDCGLLVAPGDVRELARALVSLAEQDDLRDRMGRNAAAAAAAHDWSRRAEVILEKVSALKDLSGARTVRPPRVAYVLKMFPRFSETFVINEILELERQGMDLRVFSMKEPSGRRQADADRVRAAVTVLPRLPSALRPDVVAAHLRMFRHRPGGWTRTLLFALLRRDVRALAKFVQAGVIADACRREGIGHIHAHFASGPARVAKMAGMICGLPFSFTAHAKDLYWEGHRHTESHKMKKRVRLARFVVTVSRQNERFLNSLGFKVKEGKIRTLYIGLCLAEFPFLPPSSRAPTPTPLVLAVGRLMEKKGFHVLIESLALLRRRGVRFRCVIAGEGPDEDLLRGLIRERGLEGKVRLVGAVPLDRLRRRYYSQARVLAQPCVIAADGDRDGIPTVLLEAMALGVPVISTSVSGIPEAIQDGVDGFLTPPGDVALLAERITTLLTRPDRADEIARAARAKVERQFDLKSNAASLRRLFQRSLLGWPERRAERLAPDGPAEAQVPFPIRPLEKSEVAS